jgi:NAD(P)-dependent dehydrogenase (short-subunit alcohol dehydrogenase family)
MGPIDILINNAGISGKARIDDPNAAEVWDRLIEVNLQGLFNVTHAFVPALKASHGCIVNLSSIVAFVSGISSAGYIASKGAVRSFTQALARDLAPFGVRANAVAPGLMLTEMVAPQLQVPGGTDWYMSRVPMKRGGEPAEIVGPVVFLASALASYVTGVVLPVDGGFLSA